VEVRKSIEKKSFGVVSINQRSLARNVEIAESKDPVMKAHAGAYDFYLVQVTVGVIGLGGSAVNGFQVDLSLPDRRVNANDAWLLDVYPRIETAAGRVHGHAYISVSGALEIGTSVAPGSSASAKIDGSSSISYTYNPIFQSFGATFNQARAIWNFDKVGDEVKAGPIDLRLLVAVRKTGRVAADKTVFLTARIKAEFSGGVFFGRSDETAGKIQVSF